MSESQKYYTPAPEDLRIGFELEVQDKVVSDIWRSHKIKYPHEISFLIGNQLEKGQIRVPYLTAEQIEAEGWARRDDNEFTVSINSLCEYVLSFEPQFSDNIRIRKDVMDQTVYLFFGKCRCINDLRLICKMLGIETTKS